MRFRSELLQRPKDEAEASLNKIYTVYMTPDGRVDNGDVGRNTAAEHSDAGVRNSED